MSLGTSAPAVPTPVEWTFDPWQEERRAAIGSAIALPCLWLAILAFRQPLLFSLAVGVLVSAMFVPSVVPTRCRLDDTGAAKRGALGWLRRAWRDVRRVEGVPIGVLLSPFPARHFLDTTRALTLPMPAGRRGELRALTQALWSAHGG